jgi:hypothetical protein
MGLAQMRYRGTGPKFIKRRSRVLYRWSDVSAYLDGQTRERTGAVLGANCRRIRTNAGVTQDELARAARQPSPKTLNPAAR